MAMKAIATRSIPKLESRYATKRQVFPVYFAIDQQICLKSLQLSIREINLFKII